MNEYQDFSSLPPQVEQEFVPFERHSRAASKTARLVGVLVGGGFLLFILILVFSSEKREDQHAKDLLQDELSVEKDQLGEEKPKTAPAPAVTPALAPEGAPAPGAAPAPAEGAAPAPTEAAPAAAPAAEPAANPAPKSE